MATNFEFQEWWNKEKEIHRGTSVVVKMENPNWSMVELQSPDDDFQHSDKQGRGKNARQLTWVWLLKAHRAAGCVAWLAQGLWSLLSAVKRRVTLNKNQNRVTEEDKPGKSKLYRVIRGFLLFAILMLGFEIAAYMKGWHFSRPHFDFSLSLDLQGVLHSIYSEWVFVRATYLAPPLQTLANFCIVLFLIQSADRLVLAMGCLWIHIKKIKPVPQFEFPSSAADLEKGASADYPMVLVQIPMCNEMEVYQQSIAAVCNLD